MAKKKNPIVFLDVAIDGGTPGRMVFELFSDVVSKTVENFRALCTGEKGTGRTTGKPLHYKGCIFHRIINGFMAQGGDFSRRDGKGGESIYGGKFEDENFVLQHDGPGLLSMANAGRDSNGSQFFITFKAAPHLNGKHVVFGKLIMGHETLKKMEHVDVDGSTPTVPVKIVNCGELDDHDKKKATKAILEKDISSDDDAYEGRRKGRHKRPSKGRRRKKRRRYESDSSSDTEIESSDYDSDSESDSSSSSDISSSSHDRHRRRKKYHRRDKYKRGKRKRGKKRDRRCRRRDRKLKHKSRRRISERDTETESTSESSSEDDQDDYRGCSRKAKIPSHVSVEDKAPLSLDKETTSNWPNEGDTLENSSGEGAKSPRENGELQINGSTAEVISDGNVERQPHIGGKPSKSRSPSMSSKPSMSKSMSISPNKSPKKSPNVHQKRSVSRSSFARSPTGSPVSASQRSSVSRRPGRKGESRSPVSRSPARRSLSQSPIGQTRRGPNSPVNAHPRSISRSSSRSVPRRSPTPSPVRDSSQKSISTSPVRDTRRSISRSSARSLQQKSPSRSPVRSSHRRSISRSSARDVRKSPVRSTRISMSRSSPRARSRRSISRSPPSNRGRSLSRSASPDESSRRIRRGWGFRQEYSYARKYRTPSERSPLRTRWYSGRSDRDRYLSYRSYYERTPPRRYRSPPRRRTPPRYRSRRSHSRSISHSPVGYRNRGNGGYSRSPAHSRSPSVERLRSRDEPRDNLRAEKWRSATKSSSSSRSGSLSRSRSRSRSRSSPDTPSPKRASVEKSRSTSSSSDEKKGLVSYGDGSPDSAVQK